MAVDSTTEQDPDDSDSEFVEKDPLCRYGRYREVLGKGAFKTVYRAFDELEGIEVAWNQIKLNDVLRNVEDFDRLRSEVHLLKTLKHKNIIKFYNSWVDNDNGNINFITEIFTSGNLRQYRKRHKHVDLRALKNWSRQILQGLLYLHSHDPPVIHRDLKCDNIFVNGNQGEVKIGDLGLAAILQKAHSAHSVIGTPEFMAPELYEEEYNELVDIYAFGMCLMELVTFEYPYAECTNAAQIYKKVTSGIKPASLEKVQDPEVKRFIEKCIAEVSARLSARELLVDPFLQPAGVNNVYTSLRRPNPKYSDDSGKFDATATGSAVFNEDMCGGSHDFMVEGQRRDVNTIFLKLRIADSTGRVRNIHFPFDIEVDTALSVATEMVAELDLTDQDVTTIAEMIDSEIQAHIPEWASGNALEDNNGGTTEVSDKCDSEIKDEISPLASESELPPGGLVLERLPSGRKYWSDSPKQLSRGSPARPSHSGFSSPFSERCGESPSADVNEDSEVGSFADSNSCGDQNAQEEQSLDSPLGENQDTLGDQHLAEGSLPSGENGAEQVDLRILVDKLEHVLVEQHKELEELRKKHELVIADLLKELSPEARHRVFNICHLKSPTYTVQNKAHWYSGHSTNSDSSFLQVEASPSHIPSSAVDTKSDCSEVPTVNNNVTNPKGLTCSPGSSRIFNIIGKVKSQECITENGDVRGPKPNLLKGDPKSASTLGIAVILSDDMEKS